MWKSIILTFIRHFVFIALTIIIMINIFITINILFINIIIIWYSQLWIEKIVCSDFRPFPLVAGSSTLHVKLSLTTKQQQQQQ